MKLEKTVTISQSIKLIKFYIIFANNEKIHNPAVAGASAVQLAPLRCLIFVPHYHVGHSLDYIFESIFNPDIPAIL